MRINQPGELYAEKSVSAEQRRAAGVRPAGAGGGSTEAARLPAVIRQPSAQLTRLRELLEQYGDVREDRIREASGRLRDNEYECREAAEGTAAAILRLIQG